MYTPNENKCIHDHHLGHNYSSQGADITVLELLVEEKSEPCWFKYLKQIINVFSWMDDRKHNLPVSFL